MKTKTINAWKYFVVFGAGMLLLAVRHAYCEDGALEAKITEPEKRIVTKDSNKFIFFGEDDEDITLDGESSGDAHGGTVKYSWHSGGADPENVPEEEGEFADESSSGPISFSADGTVTFTVHSVVGDHDCQSASTDVKMSKVTFEYVSQGTLNGDEVYTYIDEEDEGTGDEPKIKTKVKVSASGSPGEVTIGELKGDGDDDMKFKSDNQEITDLSLSSESKKEIVLETTKQDGDWKFKISTEDSE